MNKDLVEKVATHIKSTRQFTHFHEVHIVAVLQALGLTDVECGGCDGTGMVHDFSSKTEWPNPDVKCPTCQGTGKIKSEMVLVPRVATTWMHDVAWNVADLHATFAEGEEQNNYYGVIYAAMIEAYEQVSSSDT